MATPSRRVTDDAIVQRLDDMEEHFQEYRTEMRTKTDKMLDQQIQTNGRVSDLEITAKVGEALSRERRDVALQTQRDRAKQEEEKDKKKDRLVEWLPNSLVAVLVVILTFLLTKYGMHDSAAPVHVTLTTPNP